MKYNCGYRYRSRITNVKPSSVRDYYFNDECVKLRAMAHLDESLLATEPTPMTRAGTASMVARFRAYRQVVEGVPSGPDSDTSLTSLPSLKLKRPNDNFPTAKKVKRVPHSNRRSGCCGVNMDHFTVEGK